MKTFTESLQAKKNTMMLENCFFLMSTKNIDPFRFVEWYVSVGMEKEEEGILVESSIEWLEDEILLAEGFGDRWKQGYRSTENTPKRSPLAYGMGRSMGSAAQMGGKIGGWLQGQGGDIARSFGAGVDAQPYNSIQRPLPPPGQWQTTSVQKPLSPPGRWQTTSGEPPIQTGVQSSVQGQSQNSAQAQPEPAFMSHVKIASNAVNDLSKRLAKSTSLKKRLGPDFSQFQNAIVSLINILQQPTALVQTETVELEKTIDSSNGFSDFTKRISLRNKIKGDLRELQQEFNVDPEKFVDWYMSDGQYLNEGWFDGVKDFASNMWANAKSAWINWGNAGRERQALVDTERDNSAINRAMQALGQLQDGMVGHKPAEDFATIMGQVKNYLTKLSSEAPKEESPSSPSPEEAPSEESPSMPSPVVDKLDAYLDRVSKNPEDLDSEITKILGYAKVQGINDIDLANRIKSKNLDPTKFGLEDPEEIEVGKSTTDHVTHNMPLFAEFLQRKI